MYGQNYYQTNPAQAQYQQYWDQSSQVSTAQYATQPIATQPAAVTQSTSGLPPPPHEIIQSITLESPQGQQASSGQSFSITTQQGNYQQANNNQNIYEQSQNIQKTGSYQGYGSQQYQQSAQQNYHQSAQQQAGTQSYSLHSYQQHPYQQQPEQQNDQLQTQGNYHQYETFQGGQQQQKSQYSNPTYQQQSSKQNNSQSSYSQNNHQNNQRKSSFSWQQNKGESSRTRHSNQQITKHDLNDFGDMGAAVEKYSAVEPGKSYRNHNEPSMSKNQIHARQNDNHPYRKKYGLTVWDDYNLEEVPEPYQRFEDFKGLPQQQLNALYNAGFQAPTPIQAQSWPIAMQDRDLISIAKTGSGKTLAFLLPAYRKIDQYQGGPRGIINILVLAPTRELATQIQDEADKFGSVAGYYSACAYGGAPKRDQLKAIHSGISVLVATPGRLNDFLESNQVDLSCVFYLVLDEADRMLDMGFEPQIRTIIRKLPRKRQTLMFSATWPEEVRRLANDFLSQPVNIQLGNNSGGLQANEDIKQHLILLQSGEDKDRELINLIKSRFQRNRELVLIFVARKNTCDFVTNTLNRVGIQASAMHGDRDQNYREKTLAAFRDGSRPIMVATDVASRGIDVKGISAVINYDLANTTEDYVHRIGRTGRAGMSGESFTFLTHSHDDTWKAMGIVEVMQKAGQYPPPEVQQMIDRLKQRQQQNKDRRAAENEQFSKVLLVAEKPSVAKSIAEHLSGGRFRTRRGQSRANQIFEFIKYFPPAQQKCKLMVTSVVGHIFGLNFLDGRVKDISTLFDAKVEKVIEESTKKLRIVEHLQELGQEADYLYLWLDCDREGENIGFEVISLTREYIHYDNVYRARFSALTKVELVNAYENPARPDKYAAMSVDARQELDLKIGVAFSRLMTRAFLNMAKEKFRLRDQRVVSYGPCQTPTLWFCVQRHKEIKNFQPQQFFTVSVMLNFQGQHIPFRWVKGKVGSLQELQQMEQAVFSSRNASIVQVKEEKRYVNKPLGLNTVTLLKACSKGLGISPTAAMNAAEHLYTCGYISYPRTETSKYPPSFDLYGALEEQVHHPHWGRVASQLLNSGRVNPPQRGFDVGDHPPITPIRAATRHEITKANEWRIYDYVTRHFIASLHENMEYMEKKLQVDVNGYQFDFTWHEVLDKGFMFAMPWKLKGLNLNETQMPPTGMMQQGHTVPITNFKKEEEYTKPPDYLQESELITLMDKHGIGTDASIPQHIKNVQDRHYVDVCGPGTNGERGQLIPTKKFFGKNNRGGGHHGNQERPTSRHMVPRGFGLAFLSCFEELDFELCEPSIRAYMEKQVSKIATGETEKGEVVSSNLKLFYDKFLSFRSNLEKVSRFFAPKGQGNVQLNVGYVKQDGNQGGYGNQGTQRGYVNQRNQGGSGNQDVFDNHERFHEWRGSDSGGRGGIGRNNYNRGGRGGGTSGFESVRGGRGGRRGGNFGRGNNSENIGRGVPNQGSGIGHKRGNPIQGPDFFKRQHYT